MHIQRGEEQVGRAVWYSPPHHLKNTEDEHGLIVRWNEHYVFVQFDADRTDHAKACRRENLYWAE